MSHGHAAGASVMVLLTIGGFIYLGLGASDHPYGLPAAGVQFAPAGGHGCRDFNDELRLMDLSASGDAMAAGKFFGFRQGAGVCGGFNAGDKIVVEGKAHHSDVARDKLLHGMICARQYGAKYCNWMPAADVFPILYDTLAD